MWNYFYYLAYLKNKEPTEYTGIESYVYNKVNIFIIFKIINFAKS
jgi:hypothetical protein